MKLSELKNHLNELTSVEFELPNGKAVPAHFHITEVGKVDKHFIDCGGTVREESLVSLQLWESVDVWHRLKPSKLLNIISISEDKLGIQDKEIEVEYQAETIGKYGLSFGENGFKLTQKQTACLAEENCGIPVEKVKVKLSEIGEKVSSCCEPESGCC